jgi:hypothetical protein
VTWADLYRSDLQGLWALAVPPALVCVGLLLVGRPAAPGAEPRAAAFVHWWAVAVAAESVCDAVLPKLGVPMLLFVLLGDARVFLLLEWVVAPERGLARHLAVTAAWTLVVPCVTATLYLALAAAQGPLADGPLATLAAGADGQILWLIYEAAFLGLALGLRAVSLPRRAPRALAWGRTVLAYVAAYYALWAASDVLILTGHDAGWALRVVPNQLYYGVWPLFVWATFFSPRYAAASTATQASR